MHARRVPAPCVVCLPIGDCCVRHHFMSPQLHTCAHKRAALAAALTRKTLMAGLLATPGLELKSVPSPKGLTPRQLRRLGSTRKHVAWIQSHYTPHTIPAGLVAPMQAICVYQAGDNEAMQGIHTHAHVCAAAVVATVEVNSDAMLGATLLHAHAAHVTAPPAVLVGWRNL